MKGTTKQMKIIDKNVFILILRHKQLEAIKLKTQKEQFLVFENKESMETWLHNNGFVYGHCNGFANVPGGFYWFHQKDTPIDLVEIEIQVKIINEDVSEERIEKLMYR